MPVGGRELSGEEGVRWEKVVMKLTMFRIFASAQSERLRLHET